MIRVLFEIAPSRHGIEAPDNRNPDTGRRRVKLARLPPCCAGGVLKPVLTLGLGYLKYGVHVCEECDFRRAPAKLSRLRLNVCRRLQTLEQQLGVSLLDRIGKGRDVTPEDRRFVHQATVGARLVRKKVAVFLVGAVP